MPYLDIRLGAPCLPETVERFATHMTELTADLLHKKRELTSVSVQCVPPNHWYVGGQSMGAEGGSTFFLEVNVTAGTNTKDEKAAFIAAAFAAAEGILGKLDAASYVIVRDVAADAWGWQGLTQEFRRQAASPPA
ncbi:MAG: tautomerase family protein [Sterolibacteriaceae bacterium MAG5]|nr:tautomerase family protein [Candidatus Nitricoxidireducens bremensis]